MWKTPVAQCKLSRALRIKEQRFQPSVMIYILHSYSVICPGITVHVYISSRLVPLVHSFDAYCCSKLTHMPFASLRAGSQPLHETIYSHSPHLKHHCHLKQTVSSMTFTYITQYKCSKMSVDITSMLDSNHSCFYIRTSCDDECLMAKFALISSTK